MKKSVDCILDGFNLTYKEYNVNHLGKILAAATLGLCSQTALANQSFVADQSFLADPAFLAAPSFLVTHNLSDAESNAYIDGTVGSPFPSKAWSDNAVSWVSVRMACIGHTHNNQCKALVKVATNTPNPLAIGWMTMDLTNGEITPKEVFGNGYSLTVNGPGEVTLRKE